MDTFWLTATSTSVAVLALFRPELTRLIRRWTNRIDFFPAARIEIGFSEYGPTVGLHGTLTALGDDQLITSMSVRIIRTADEGTHEFLWGAFRSSNLSQPASQLEIPSAFTVRPSIEKKINIQFHDTKTRDLISGKVLNLRKIYEEYLEKNRIDIERAGDSAYHSFVSKNATMISDTANEILNFFYWNEGVFILELRVFSNSLKNPNIFKYTFSLSKNNYRDLATNITILVKQACFVKDVNLSFSTPEIIKC